MQEDIISRITSSYILMAVEEIDKEGSSLSPGNDPIGYDLIYNGNSYSFKEIILRAARLATSENITDQDIDESLIFDFEKMMVEMGFAFTRKVRTVRTPAAFTKGLYKFLDGLSPRVEIRSWVFFGKTAFGYGAPRGPWKVPGFQFDGDNHSFILRSVWESGNILVVESNNLEGQLANLSLESNDKFQHDNGIVTIIDNYDMTVGFGKRSKKEVKQAFDKVGIKDNIITTFHANDYSWESIVVDILQWGENREKVKEYLQQTTPAGEPSAGSYWMLKIFGANWELDTIRVGEECYFGSYYYGKKREEYERIVSVKAGDLGFAYDFSGSKGIVFLFEITESIHVDERKEEIIRFKIVEFVNPPKRAASLADIVNFSGELDIETRIKLFPLTEQEFGKIKELIGGIDLEVQLLPETFYISPINNDSSAKEIEDELGFESDVQALASVIVLQEISPPLAIGLFGNWGMGKSFFMNKLQKKITDLSGYPRDIFCKKVLQITFNSWHYSDSNLWASLITKIFEELQNYGKDQPDNVNAIFKQLHSTKEMLQITLDEKKKVEEKIKDLKQEQEVFARVIATQSEKLKPLSLGEIGREILRSESVQEEIGELNRKYSFLHISEYDDIQKNLDVLEDGAGTLRKSLQYVYAFRKGKGWVALFFAILIFAAIYFMIAEVDLVKKYLDDYKVLLGSIGLLLGQMVIFLRPAIKVIHTAFQKLKDLQATLVKLKKDASAKYAEEQEGYSLKIKAAEIKKENVQQEIELLSIEEKKLNNEIEEISSGKKIIRFIESRVTDERYVNNLGIISWIRKDFEELDFLLKQQYDTAKLLESGRMKIENAFKIDRIILYIDDLDRCDVSIVVKVLEAINLLLAFPLFVVVVGVDPRWMHKALTKKYSNMLGESSRKNEIQAATSFDYLEKIFQIPFSIRSMDPLGKNKLISSQLISRLKLSAATNLKKTEPPSEIVEPQGQIPSPGNATVQDLGKSPGDSTVIVVTDPASDHIAPQLHVEEETLQIAEPEIKFMQSIAFLIGDSPRTIKRYINIYRIIRTHSLFIRSKDDELVDYCSTMLLLAVLTGAPDDANLFFRSLDNMLSGNFSLQEFLRKHLDKYKNKAKFEQLITALINDESIRVLGNVDLSRFTKNAHLIKRFSFRNLG